jgi:dTDP-glucose pyrophosphorylase
MDKAVILAAGRGSRMQRACGTARLSAEQAAAADSGVKSMMPVGRPFVDYVLNALKLAGYRRICLVAAPGSEPLQSHCRQFSRDGFDIQFAIQSAPLGTANALTAARDFAGSDAFLAINADNYYPIEVLRKLRGAAGAAVAAFRAEGLGRGNITADRLRNYAFISADRHGRLLRIVEKPAGDDPVLSTPWSLINMNCWRFTATIFTACSAIPLSSRNEYEIPDAVSYAINVLKEPFLAIEVNEPVLDLSTRADVADVARRFASVKLEL